MRKHCIYYITLLFAMFLSSMVCAQRNYSFKYINSDMGLLSNSVKSILQDRFGFIWVGTKNGLNRFDGRDIKEYNCYDYINKRGNNNIGALCEDNLHNIWVGTDRGVYIYNSEKDLFSFFDCKTADGVGLEDWVQDIVTDKNGNVWILIPNQGVFCCTKESVKYYDKEQNGLLPLQAISICVSQEGGVFVGTASNGVYFYNNVNDSFAPLPIVGEKSNSYRTMRVQGLCDDRSGGLIFSTQNGHIYRYDIYNGTVELIPFSAYGKIYFRSIECVDQELWLATQNGLYVLDLSDKTETYFTDSQVDGSALSDNMVYTIYVDSKKNIWLGTIYGGLNYCQRSGFIFEKYSYSEIYGSLSNKRIRGLAQSSDGNIWIGSEYGGLNKFDPKTKKISQLPRHKDKVSLVLKNFNDRIYGGFSGGGADIFDEKGRSIRGNISFKDQLISIYSVLVDSKGVVWYGHGGGLCRRNPGEKDHETVLANGWIHDIYETSDGKIWLADMGYGVRVYDTTNGSWKNYPYDEYYSNGLRTNSVSSIMEDSKGRIWLSSDRGGLISYNAENDNFISYGIEDGLPDNVTYNILEDDNGYLWFGTNKGLVKFNPYTAESKIFTVRDGLPANQFNYNSAVKSSDGLFYFGGVEGLIVFDPNQDVPVDSIAPIYFTRLRVLNEDVDISDKNSPITCNILFADKIKLKHTQSTFSLNFVSPNYDNQGVLNYSYRIYPISPNWAPVDDAQGISFINLSRGLYRLDVKVSNGNIENINTLQIEVLPPWYNTILANIIYVFFIVALLIGWFIWYRNRKEKELEELHELFTVKKEKELFESKVQFFTEIAHEIRTPLTLIGTPLEAIEELDMQDTRLQRYLAMMRQNVNRLLDLTGQLLDFQKLGASRLRLKFENVDVTSLLTKTLDRFEPAMSLNNKVLIRNISDTPIVASIDREAITKIFSNLLNNALKYARHTIIVELSCDNEYFNVKVISDSEKFAPDEAVRIFEPFYQKDNKESKGGIGIGLPLSRQLAEAHQGTLSVEQDNNADNTFVLRIPLNKEGILSNNVSSVRDNNYIVDTDSNQATNALGYSLLLVEDNDSLRELLVEQLGNIFMIETARNGKEALDKLYDSHFNLIVTDIMMPVMDGFELCTTIKADIDLSHIPVVFLTAKHDLESKLKGLKCGGEAFIEKPFSIKFFKQQILSLLDNRRREREAFLKKPFVKVDNMKMTKADEEFMNKVVSIIEDNINNDNFSVESMAELFCVSRSSLLRKIKMLFNLSPVELIRLVRLKKAAELIQEGKYRIGDVCYMVGISSLSYFSKLFFKQFGVTPKDFEKQCQKNAQIVLTTKLEEMTDDIK